MPRKHPRPAARKAAAKLKARAARMGRFKRAAAPILRNPRLGDDHILAAYATAILIRE